MKTPLYKRAAKSIGKLLLRAREMRKLTEEQAAKLLGIEVSHYLLLEHGKALPKGVELQERVYGWVALGKTYVGQPLEAKSSRNYNRRTHAIAKAVITREDANEIRKLAVRYEINAEDIIYYAIRQFLASKHSRSTFAQAAHGLAESWFNTEMSNGRPLRRLVGLVTPGRPSSNGDVSLPMDRLERLVLEEDQELEEL